MEPLLGFAEPPANDVVFDQSHSFKLVPWINWDEWGFVRISLFSSSPQSVASALQRITAWRSRGCLPVVVEVTASIVEIQQKDPFSRHDLAGQAVDSEEMLAMLYCMAIMRLVNGVIEKTRKKSEVSIAEAAGAIGIPRLLIDIRHGTWIFFKFKTLKQKIQTQRALHEERNWLWRRSQERIGTEWCENGI